MIASNLRRTLQRGVRVAPRFFSSTHNNEWGVQYNDECLKFEKEWQQVANKLEGEQSVYVKKELSEAQQKKVEMLADKMLDLNIFEMRYFAITVKDRIQKTSGINPLKLNMDWPSIKMDAAGTWPPLNPNWFKQ